VCAEGVSNVKGKEKNWQRGKKTPERVNSNAEGEKEDQTGGQVRYVLKEEKSIKRLHSERRKGRKVGRKRTLKKV